MERREKGELFRIGEVARLFRLSQGTLRHYERLGLLAPEYVDPATGYRYYSTRQFESLNTIRYLRTLDMPLEEIQSFLRNRDVDKITGMLLRQRAAVEEKERQLRIVRRKIDNRLAQLADARASDLETVAVKAVPACQIAWLRGEMALSSYLDLEHSIRALEAGQASTAVFLGKVGVGISAESLAAGRFDRYELVFLRLDREDEYTGRTETIPAADCVTVRFCGEHRDAPRYYEKLMAFIGEKGLTVAGFSREITMIDYGLTNNTEEFVTEIQIPVK